MTSEFATPGADLKGTSPSLDGNAGEPAQSHRHHVDLFNFDDPRFENYRYVLTSPRSIEACQRLGVKPVALLPKSFARFQDEMKSSGLDIRELYDRFLEVEKKRLDLVELCRDERRKVVDEELVRQRDAVDVGLSRSASQTNMDKSVTFSTQSKGENNEPIKRSVTSLLPDKSFGGRPPHLKMAATFGLGVPANYETEQQNLAAEADKARHNVEARAQHSNRLTMLKQQLDELELETRMLRLQSSSTPSTSKSGRRSGLRKTTATAQQQAAQNSGGDNTIDESWLMSEMKKQVGLDDEPRLARSFFDDSEKKQRVRAQSAGTRPIVDLSVFGTKKPQSTEASPLRQMIANHVDEMQRQAENQRSVMEHSQMADEWRQLVAERKEAEEAQARARRRRLMLEKKLKTQQERLERQLAQRGNLRRIEEEEQVYRQMLKSTITSKDRRTRELLRDKDEEILRSRTISRMSERLREEMRRSVNADSFDKKAHRVLLENALGRGPRTHLTNVSKLKLG